MEFSCAYSVQTVIMTVYCLDTICTAVSGYYYRLSDVWGSVVSSSNMSAAKTISVRSNV